tara:strand:+ start:183 stop:458 length:276 start_codon:yes stop_codon:yes gene_type:complete
MAETKKFTKEELEEITNLRNANAKAVNDFGAIEVELLVTNQHLDDLSNQKENLHEEYKKLQETEKQLVKKLNEKYGAGTVNLESGEFIPTN